MSHLIGWRDWICSAEGRLYSLCYRVDWPFKEPLRTRCWGDPSWFPRLAGHRDAMPIKPSISCTCGIHAFKEAHQPAERSVYGYLTNADLIVSGRVLLGGLIVYHSKGYRAEEAYPLEVFIPDQNTELALEVIKNYGVSIRRQSEYPNKTV